MALPLLSFQSNVVQTYLETTHPWLLCQMTLQVFAEIFDPVIKDRHNGYDPRAMKHPTDLDASKVNVCFYFFMQNEFLRFPFNSIFLPTFLGCYLSSRSIQACLMKSTSCPPVYAQAAVSVVSAFPLPAAALSDVKSKGSRSRPWLAWRETSLVITTAWMKWLNKSSRDLSTWVASIQFFQSWDILVLGW